MIPNTLFGLPAHPLFVHAPLVLVPLAALGVILMVAVPKWHRALRIPVALFTLAAAVSAFLANETGEGFEDTFRNRDATTRALIETHANLAEQLKPFVLLFTVATLAYIAVDWWLDRRSSDAPKAWRWATWGLGGVAVLISVFSTVWVWRTGHSGAEAVWHDTKVIAVERDDR